MRLEQLLRGFSCTLLRGDGTPISSEEEITAVLTTEVPDITNDSRKIAPGGLFFCIEGANADGHDFAEQAVADGARVLVVRKLPAFSEKTAQVKDVILVQVEDTRYAMAFIAANFYGNPGDEMAVIGITGTKGKTTTAYMIRDMLEGVGIPTGLVGTIEMTYGEVHRPAGNTTPESIVLQKLFREMADAGIRVVVMEVSSQALMLHRTQGFLFAAGVFTNLSSDHIGPNEHRDFDEYLHCKSLLFRQCKVGIVNGDDPYVGKVLRGHTCTLETFGQSERNDLSAWEETLVNKPGELGITFTTRCLDAQDALNDCRGWEVRLPGIFNVNNALCAIAVCRHFTEDIPAMQKALAACSVKGRIEIVPLPGFRSEDEAFTLLIDYAHNAVALENVLETLRGYHPHRILCLFGCGGNRAKSRRFEMGEVSGRLADLTVITSDNPRFEEPLDIMADIRTGIEKTDGAFVEIPDRKEAIRFAMKEAAPHDIVLLAGKGHEDYQEIKGKKYPMDERVLIREILEEEARRG